MHEFSIARCFWLLYDCGIAHSCHGMLYVGKNINKRALYFAFMSSKGNRWCRNKSHVQSSMVSGCFTGTNRTYFRGELVSQPCEGQHEVGMIHHTSATLLGSLQMRPGIPMNCASLVYSDSKGSSYDHKTPRTPFMHTSWSFDLTLLGSFPVYSAGSSSCSRYDTPRSSVFIRHTSSSVDSHPPQGW